MSPLQHCYAWPEITCYLPGRAKLFRKVNTRVKFLFSKLKNVNFFDAILFIRKWLGATWAFFSRVYLFLVVEIISFHFINFVNLAIFSRLWKKVSVQLILEHPYFTHFYHYYVLTITIHGAILWIIQKNVHIWLWTLSVGSLNWLLLIKGITY